MPTALLRVSLLGAIVSLLAFGGHAAVRESPLPAWIRRHAQPIETCAPREDAHDLAGLRRIVGASRIVALGDGTLGTREFFQLKHRIIDYLATEMGFTTVAIDANLPEAWKLNDYVVDGRGDPKTLIGGMYLWNWNTEELLAFVEWARAFNASGRGRIRFAGFGMIKPGVPGTIVGDFVSRVDSAWADSARAMLAAIQKARSTGGEAVVSTGSFPVKEAAAHRVRFSGWIRTEEVRGFAGLWWRADVGTAYVAFDNMQGQNVNGTRDWRRYEIALDVPPNVDKINFGMMLVGTGRAWFDSLAIEIDGHPWSRPDQFDLAMESPAGPIGFGRESGLGYRIAMDDSAAKVGRLSLCLASLATGRPDPAPLWADAEARAERMVRRFETERVHWARKAGPEETDWAERNAHLLLQRARYGVDSREAVHDSCKAANVEWILRRVPKGSKIVLWAHNQSLARTPGSLGDRLTRRFGKDAVVFGFATQEGQYLAFRDRVQANELVPGPAGSIESLAAASGVPAFLLDLRPARGDRNVTSQLANGLRMRSIGAAATDDQFSPVSLTRDFDALVFVQKTAATTPLGKH